ncbi:hypothetical protein LWI29_029877 [Acer saccharum]|uniref:Uncharacterized protein n=1 Tax=Acer saccharum TaxID=4024 RepID=A0AA39VXH2_ACESA|nr:hypothetical protein LWI29_029877 [Acer saccharum]
MVDEETTQKRRLDKGRILVLLKQEECVSAKVLVDTGIGSFTVTVKEENSEIDGPWIDSFLGLQKDTAATHQSKISCEEEDKGAVVEKVGLRGQSREENREALDVTGEGFKRCQNKKWKATIRKERKEDQSSWELSEVDRSFSNIPRRKNHEKGKVKWVPKPRQSVQKRKDGKLVIGMSQSHMGKCRVSDSTNTSEEEGLISDFKSWRGERGECSKPVGQSKERHEKGDGLDVGELTFGLQNSNFSRSQSLSGPLKEFMDRVERGVGMVDNEVNNGLQKIIVSRSQSLDRPIKDYLENLEQAFIMAKLKSSVGYKGEDNQLMGNKIAHNHKSSVEETSSAKSISVVKETKEFSDSNSSEDDSEEGIDREEDSFKSISATREAREEEIEPPVAAEGLNRNNQIQTSKFQHRKKNRGSKISCAEVCDEDEEVSMLLLSLWVYRSRVTARSAAVSSLFFNIGLRLVR